MTWPAASRSSPDIAPAGLGLVHDLLATAVVGNPRRAHLLATVASAQRWLAASTSAWADAVGPPAAARAGPLSSAGLDEVVALRAAVFARRPPRWTRPRRRARPPCPEPSAPTGRPSTRRTAPPPPRAPGARSSRRCRRRVPASPGWLPAAPSRETRPTPASARARLDQRESAERARDPVAQQVAHPGQPEAPAPTTQRSKKPGPRRCMPPRPSNAAPRAAPPACVGPPRTLARRCRGVAGWPGREGAPALRPATQPVRVAE
jgi:hypothetical protein